MYITNQSLCRAPWFEIISIYVLEYDLLELMTCFLIRMVARMGAITGSTNAPREGSGQYTGLARLAYDTLRDRDECLDLHESAETASFRELERHRNPARVLHFTPIVIRSRQEAQFNPIASFMNRRTGSPTTGLNFDFFATPSRTVDGHSASMTNARVKQDY